MKTPMSFPRQVSLLTPGAIPVPQEFWTAWSSLMEGACHQHAVWSAPFVETLRSGTETRAFQAASLWAVNMVVGSYCFPRYVAALAARAEQDAVRYGLIENAWDEAGSYGHTSRSHFWLAVKLARLLGLQDTQITRINPLPEAKAYTDEHYAQCATGDFGFALGMICLIEEFTTPEFTLLFQAFLRSCQTGMGMSPDAFVLQGGAEYFTANIADDERHREEMPQLVALWLSLEGTDLGNAEAVKAALEPVRAGAHYSADLRQKFFEGIHTRCQHGGTFRQLVES